MTGRRRRRWGGSKVARLRLVVVRRHGYVCWLSGPGYCTDPRIDPTLPGTHPLGLTLDHVLPASRGGSDDPANLRPAHLRCNQRRRARLASEVKARGQLRATESHADWLDPSPRFSEPGLTGSTPPPCPPTTPGKNGRTAPKTQDRDQP